MISRKYSKIIFLLAFIINTFLLGLTRGFDFHYHKIGLFEAHLGEETYIYICFFLLVFLVGISIKNKLASNIICFASLPLAIFQYKFIYLFTTGLLDEKEPIGLLFRESIPLNLISFSIITILLIYQIIIAFQDLFSKNRTPLNTF